MADSPTPQQQETKGDDLHLPGIERSDSKAELKKEQEKKEDNSTKKTSEPAPPRRDSPPLDDERQDERRESQSETKDQNNTSSPSTTKGTNQKTQPPQDSTETSDTSKSKDKNQTKSESSSDNKKKAVGFEEVKKSEKKGNKESNQNSNKENKENQRNESKTKSKGDNSPRKGGNETKSPRKEEEGAKGGKKGQQEEEEDTSGGKRSERSGELSSRSSNGGTEMSEGRTKQREFFKNELFRLESSLKRESSKIVEPQKKAHTPYIFNTLEPYYNTKMTRFLIELPDEMKHGHTSRRTAQGLTDPWLDLKMDRDVLPRVASKPVSRQVAILKKEKEIRDRKKRSAANQSSRKEGSTRLPKFPMVQLETQDLAAKQLSYGDVPGLRTELKSKYSSSARTKIDEDYKRTQNDFYRMELDKLDEVHPINRGHMRSAYFAYLQNTPGSKKAINECVRGLKSGKAQ